MAITNDDQLLFCSAESARNAYNLETTAADKIATMMWLDAVIFLASANNILRSQTLNQNSNQTAISIQIQEQFIQSLAVCIRRRSVLATLSEDALRFSVEDGIIKTKVATQCTVGSNGLA